MSQEASLHEAICFHRLGCVVTIVADDDLEWYDGLVLVGVADPDDRIELTPLVEGGLSRLLRSLPEELGNPGLARCRLTVSWVREILR